MVAVLARKFVALSGLMVLLVNLAACWIAASFQGCGTEVNYSTARGTLNVLNGPTSKVETGLPAGKRKSGSALSTQNGHYALSPEKMTTTVTGISFIPSGSKRDQVNIPVSGCDATYDRSFGSLAVLCSSDIAVPVGTFVGVMIEYSKTFTLVMNDSSTGIYSDPDAPNLLSTTAPAGGGRPIQLKDQNGGGDYNHAMTYFTSPITIGEDSTPHVYVVFDPTHWVKVMLNNGSFSAPYMGGNPPIIPSLSTFGKAVYYTNIGTVMSYIWGGATINSGISLLFLYGDATTPISVTWQDHDICNYMGGPSVVAYNGNGTRIGMAGMLGLDNNHTLAWASPGPTASNGFSITGYSGVFKMPEISTIGQTTVLSYHCSTEVPQPISGPNYTSGAPDFTADGTLVLKLLEN